MAHWLRIKKQAFPKMTRTYGNCFTNQGDKNDSYLYILYTGIH